MSVALSSNAPQFLIDTLPVFQYIFHIETISILVIGCQQPLIDIGVHITLIGIVTGIDLIGEDNVAAIHTDFCDAVLLGCNVLQFVMDQDLVFQRVVYKDDVVIFIIAQQQPSVDIPVYRVSICSKADICELDALLTKYKR